MLIQGVILLGATFQLQKSESGQSISWNKGILEYPSDFNQHSFSETTILGFEGYHQNDVKIWGLNTPFLTSFFDFKAYLKSSGSKLGVGVWYEEDERRLHLVRNLFGTHPLYYLFLPGQLCLFSTNLHALLKSAKSKGISLTPSESRLHAFLTFGRDQSVDYNGETFYKEIKCVLPGHILSVTPQGCSSAPYTRFLIPQSVDTLPGYAEQFRILLENAVRNSLPSGTAPIGSHLSGGLDSSSVSTFTKILAPENPLYTFYYDTQGAGSDDRSYALEVARNIKSDHREIMISDDSLSTVALHTRVLGYPQAAFVAPTFYDGVLKLASQLGCQTLLNGNGGDSIVGSGFEYLTVLFKERKWGLLKELLSKRTQYYSKAYQHKNWKQLSFEQQNNIVEQNFLYRRLSPSLRTMRLRELSTLYREVSAHFHLSPVYFATHAFNSFLKKFNGDTLPPITLLRQDFMESTSNTEVGTNELSTSLRGELPATFRQSFEEIFNQHFVCQNESRFIFGRYYGFENRSPFLDKSLFELCMSVPEVVKFGDGSGRMHFREAMKGILPEKVRLRSQKALIGQRGKNATLQLYVQAKEMLCDTNEVWRYIDRRKFDDTIKFLQTDHLPVENYNRSLFHVTRTVSVAAWLEWLKSEKILQ
ncbi:asparagine synthase (glutamine-hydrolyzing) [Dyadobacter sp. BE34]|uniref:asparagine synthase (glutamine-hydrolyzing) n=1 Tax=Dyadobacter fermentans TaxID=94254 RepID=A0ABU1QTA8_9BACT|nr:MULTISPECIES: asparagine synthetase B family protein [Dyadobacter]MDR6803515.1 asparagine synthase (glutamine-hydrolyzing) [Dyadobacter fermentans]MDR7041256.1 asparagine synthase (glutamine-hydrolyzing) [Dyadobacter sp. BE242]MDR7195659.1 asparagine synthase (glutamine-hydrolyzing) [Dyadobacter sp. BE34]MDR7213796.1 asparagine synthase (glutamine-hydrolyzing) [Dyadobacter sp. BE31]MDR7261066.1 asparagine synthase (glutamine-hydrolyzing) [Dyadobacter sp. BE32]